MRAFIVTAEDRPGTVARLTKAIARRGIDLLGFAGVANGRSGLVALIGADDAGVRDALAELGVRALETELVTADIENRPGGMAEVAQRLADSGVNLLLITPVGMNGDRVTFAFGASDTDLLRRTLTD
jgi:hypothetical protein